jgi:hypothetical protein
LNNFTAGVREREEANRTRVAGHLDEIQGAVANTLNLFRNWAVGFIDWLDEHCPNSLWLTTGVEPGSGEASVMVQASELASASRWIARSISRRFATL